MPNVMWAIAAAAVGCDANPTQRVAVAHAPNVRQVQRHDFGKRVVGDLHEYSHEYMFTNSGHDPIRIISLDNAKPCCGTTESVEPSTLPPGASLPVRIRLKPADGQIMHRAVLRADPPGASAEFVTMGFFYPKVKVEAVSLRPDAEDPGAPVSQRFRILAYGRSSSVGNPLESALIQSVETACWIGPAGENRLADGVAEWSRDLTVTASPPLRPGVRQSRFAIMSGGREFIEHSYQWMIPQELSASPSSLFFNADEAGQKKRVLIRRDDGEPFAVRDTVIESPEITARTDDQSVKGTHTIEVEMSTPPRKSGSLGHVEVVTTDDPPKVVRIPIYASR